MSWVYACIIKTTQANYHLGLRNEMAKNPRINPIAKNAHENFKK